MPSVLHRPSRAPWAGETDLEDALALVLDTIPELAAEPVALEDALGRVLAQDAIASRALPGFDSSAMDGYALRAADLASVPARLRLIGESRAGHPANVSLSEGEAVAISTGAMLPRGADAVVRLERTRRGDETSLADAVGVNFEPVRREGDAACADSLDSIAPGADVRSTDEDGGEPTGQADSLNSVASGADLRCAGEDGGAQVAPAVEVLDAVAPGADVRRAGEDVAIGAIALRRGEPIGPAQLGLLAALGCAAPLCARVPRVSLLVTGDELRNPDDPDRPGGVVDVNGWTIAALAQQAGARTTWRERVADDPAATRDAVAAAARDADLVVLCGGVSVGAHDHVRPSLAALGAHELFWGLALKPGHPTWFGTLGERRVPVLGLPGNPVSAMVVFTLLAGPALRTMRGEREQERERPSALLDGGWRKRPGRAHALRCALRAREDGWHVRPLAHQGSHVLSSMAAADALAIIPTAASELPDGGRVQIEPLARCW